MYVLRSIAGALVAGVKVTSWFIVTVYFGALILSIGKRLGEMESKSSRSVLKFYTKSYLKTLMIICNVLALVAFSIYLVTLGTMFSPLLIIASFIIFKMIHLVENDPNTLNDPVTFLLKEKSILYSGAIIIIYLSIGLYLEL
jgi:4-hydroxybenzoate polyprenyltransferase